MAEELAKEKGLNDEMKKKIDKMQTEIERLQTEVSKNDNRKVELESSQS